MRSVLTESAASFPQKRTEKSNLRVFILLCLRREPIRERGRTAAHENSAKIKSLIPVTRFGDIFGAVLGVGDFFFFVLSFLCKTYHVNTQGLSNIIDDSINQ